MCRGFSSWDLSRLELFPAVDQSMMLISVSFSYSKTLEDRLKLEAEKGALSVADTTVGSKQLTFTLKRVSLHSRCSAPDSKASAAQACV